MSVGVSAQIRRLRLIRTYAGWCVTRFSISFRFARHSLKSVTVCFLFGEHFGSYILQLLKQCLLFTFYFFLHSLFLLFRFLFIVLFPPFPAVEIMTQYYAGTLGRQVGL